MKPNSVLNRIEKYGGGNGMRAKIMGIILLLLALFVFFPIQGFAVDFWINDVKIDAYLKEDGTVKVSETHVYEFDGEFNGITRAIVPKDGSEIKDFSATENKTTLKVEKDEDLYKVYRKGKDETITVALSYTIEKGVEIYQDVAQFYWPFFDDRNESTYENLTINVYPPQSTSDVIAFGYDEAFQSEAVQSDGVVMFRLGEVPSETNGDIRVAYDKTIFPAATYVTANLPMKEEIVNDKNELLAKAQERADAKETLSNVAQILIPAFIVMFLFFIIRNWREARAKLAALGREMTNAGSLPKQDLSLPATISFTNHNYLPTQAKAAALLDLVRKGLVRQVSDEKFQLVNETGALPHESILIDWLFKKIGRNGEFSFSDLAAFSDNKNNYDKYSSFLMKWGEAVRKEVKDRTLYEDKSKLKLFLGLSSIVLVPFLFLFPIYDLLGWFLLALFLFIGILVYVFTYRPKNLEGLRIHQEWKQFKESYQSLSPEEWKKWPEDDQMRAYIYGLGLGDKKMIKQNKRLIEAFSSPYHSNNGFYPYSIYSFGHVGPNATTIFETADSSIGSSSSSSSSGGGTGGGGGGSGAF